MVQPFLDEEANDAIGIENEIGSLGVPITDDTVDCQGKSETMSDQEV